MAENSREIPRLDTILRRSALLIPGSMADSSREVPRLDTILRRTALLIPGSMADSSVEIYCAVSLMMSIVVCPIDAFHKEEAFFMLTDYTAAAALYA
ncbi:hypothetical protein J6590_068943 [Homalodisca vitripennis]|nr:hypothetical protein J6590_068943 [Homalodisca vitripennis]